MHRIAKMSAGIVLGLFTSGDASAQFVGAPCDLSSGFVASSYSYTTSWPVVSSYVASAPLVPTYVAPTYVAPTYVAPIRMVRRRMFAIPTVASPIVNAFNLPILFPIP